MISTTFETTPVFLVPYEPSWPVAESGFSGSFQIPTSQDAGLSLREERESLAATLRTALKYKAVLDATQAAALRSAQAAWDNRPVLCPFWPAESYVGEESEASVQGALRVWYEPDWSAWEIGTGSSPTGFTPSDDCLTAPLVWGRFESMPVPRIIDGYDDEIATFSIVENGIADYALSPKSGTLTNGASVNSETVPLLQTEHSFGWGNNTQTVEVKVDRTRIGFGRGETDTFVPQTPRSKQQMEFDWLEQSDVAYLIRLFQDRRGSVSPFWTIAAHSLTSLIYGRFYSDRITIEWELPARCGERATCKVDFLTLPTEQTIPSGETYGDTIGPQEARWFGYVITGGALTYRITSYETPIEGPGGTFTPRKINHGRIVQEINLAANDCQLTVEHWSGGPFGRLLNNPRALPLTVKIYEGLLSAPEDAEVIFTGTPNAVSAKGAKLTIQLVGLGGLASIEGPRSVLTKDCVAVYGDSRCKKDLTPLRVTADLLSFLDQVAKIDAAAADFDPNFFADGYVDRPVDGLPQRYLITSSFDAGDGKLGIEIVGDILPAPTGTEADWVLTPGCPGTWEACQARDNTENFRGEPYLPNDNPTIPALPQSAPASKK